MKSNSLFILLGLCLISSNIFAMKKAKVDQDLEEQAIAVAKEKQVEKQLLESDFLKDCKEQHAGDVDMLEKCVKEKFSEGKLDEKELEELTKNLDIASYDKKAAKNTKSMREYLSDRIHTAIRGKPKQKGKDVTKLNIKDMKFVDHALYAKLYRSQVGKNILLETTNYCISNFGSKKDPAHIANHFSAGIKGFPYTPSAKVKLTSPLVPGTVLSPYKIDSLTGKISDRESNITGGFVEKGLWKDAYEYEVCDILKDKDGNKIGNHNCNYSTSDTKKQAHRSSELIDKFRDFEFKLGPSYMKGKVSFCTGIVIKNMCEVYRCRHVYDANTAKPIRERCQKDLELPLPTTASSSPPTDYSQGDITGLKACGIIDRLQNYRKVIATLDKLDEINKGNIGSKGFKLSDTFKEGQYQGGKGEKSIEDITTVASSEMKNIEFNKGNDLEGLKEECFANGTFNDKDEKCKELTLSELDKEKAANISAEMEAETQAYLQKIKLMKENNDKEGLLKYLEQYGLGSVEQIDQLTEEEMAKLIGDEYKSQRLALKKSMLDKYNQSKASSSESDEEVAEDLTEVAKSNLVNMEQEASRIETLVQYNNILTSYLGATLTEGEDKSETTLSYQREIELDQARDNKNQEEFLTNFDDGGAFEDEGTSQSSESASMNVDLNFIDSLLGNTERDIKLEKKEGEQ